MMGLAILAVGAVGIVSLQRFAVMGTMTSRHITNVTNATASMLERMSAEAVLWTDNSTSLSAATMPTLGPALANQGQWQRPTIRGFLIDGSPIDADAAADNDPVAYCSHVRAVFLGNPSATGPTQATAARVEVRSFYAKTGRSVARECRTWTGDAVEALFDGTPQSAGTVTRNRSEYGTIFLSTIIRRNTQ
ncbi:MAG: hypothetical protein HOW73_25130 [Polyangiaceae bacterium]|nr:hypothetical protein [Polyangiaceae bacterium]